MKKQEAIRTFYNALHNAIDAAYARSNTPDDGTCNLDTPVVYYGPIWQEYRLSKADVSAAIERAGLRAYPHGRECVMIGGATIGQAYCRTLMAETFADSLKESGFSAGVYYMID